MLKIVNLSKAYGKIVVLKGIDLDLGDGIYGLFGPNGSGKTTLLKIISGFEKPTSGRIFFEGREITGMSPEKIAEIGIAIAFQIPRVFWNLSVEKNIFLACMNEEKVKKIAKLFKLEKEMDKTARKLSQGKLKLLQISMAYARDPNLLLLDEPFAGLDVESVELLLKVLRSLKQMPMLITSHRPKLLHGIANAFFELRGGVIVRSSENSS